MDNFSSVLSLDYQFGDIERLPLIETQGFDRLFRTMVIIQWMVVMTECRPDNKMVK